MRTYEYPIDSELVQVHRVERYEDLTAFESFVKRHAKSLACDTEATGTNMYAPGFRMRLAQFGTQDEAYVLPIELGTMFAQATMWALDTAENLIFHNPGFDLQVFNAELAVPMEQLWPKVTDTRILAHLIDPRGPEEGGIGQSLEALCAAHVDEELAESVKGLMTRLAKEQKTTKAKIWASIDLDHPDYNLYAGMDPIITARLVRILWPMVPASSRGLISFEHKLAEVCSYYERTGFLLDVGYSESLSEKLREDEETYTAEAENLGVENVNSTQQVADALISAGVEITERTPNGGYKVDKKLLDGLIGKDKLYVVEGNTGASIANAVKEAKKARKWRTTWVDGFLEQRDSSDRCHPNINPLRARTARMSITGIPAQTLPSSDMMVRRCFLADPGDSVVSVDYQAQELRVLAALSGDATMIEAFRNGADLHVMTARAAFGSQVPADEAEAKESKFRKYAKTANFQKVYGGGYKALAAQIGIDLETAKQVHEGFDRAYPGVGVLTRKLSKQAERDGYIVTPTGRRLPVDPQRAYASLNYDVQSTARDVTARGIIRLHEEGFTPYIRLPVHDEVVASVPSYLAEPEAEEIARVMAETMGPVFIGTDPEVGLRSWGSLYGSDY